VQLNVVSGVLTGVRHALRSRHVRVMSPAAHAVQPAHPVQPGQPAR